MNHRNATATFRLSSPLIALCVLSFVGGCGSQPFDPDCTAEKAARSTAMKATVGVGGRCTPAEAASDTAKRAAGVE
jgi:hypothetical protein